MVVEGQTELDQLEHVHVALEQLVLVLCRTAELSYGLGHYSWKFSILATCQT